jgi:hypothetical protein
MPRPSLPALLSRLGLTLRLAWAGRRLRRGRDDAERARAREALAALFRDARGLTMKIGQFTTTVSLEGPEDQQVVHAEPLPLAALLPHLERALGRPCPAVFRRLDEAAAAASLGQVHRAELLDGRVVAVKIRYPDIADAVAAELAFAGLVPGVGPIRRFGMNLDAYRRLLSENMARELDFRSEAERQSRLRSALAVPGLVVPEVLLELCRDRVMVSAWVDGERLEAARTWPQRERVQLARTLLATLFASLFRVGEVHADPNPGNYLFARPSEPGAAPTVTLLDFGCTLGVDEPRRLALLQLLLACREASSLDPLAAFAAMGFEPEKLLPIADKLPALCQVLFEPFLLDRPFVSARWQLGERVGALLGELRWWFRAAGPPDLVLLLRAFQGLATQLEALGAPLPWWPVLRATLGDDALATARAFVPPPLPPDLAAGASSLASLARVLKVAIVEGQEELLALGMPASEVAHLEEHIPGLVQQHLAKKGIAIAPIVERILAQGIRPQEVFRLDEEGRTYRVWLE